MDGTAHPVGGPKELSRIILEILERYGVELRPRQRVNEIVVERGKVTGVDVEDTAHRPALPRTTEHRRLGGGGAQHVRPDRPRAGNWRTCPRNRRRSCCSSGMDRSPAEFGMRGENHWFMPDLDDHDGFHRPPGEGTLYVSFASLNNPAARFHTVEVLELVDPRVVDQWRGTPEEERPESYRKLKDDLTERLIARLENDGPASGRRSRSPSSRRRCRSRPIQHSVLGSFYGLAATPQRLRSPRAGCRTPVKGLFVAGQDAWGSGVVGALAGGLMAANAVLKPRQLGTMWRAVAPAAVRPGTRPRPGMDTCGWPAIETLTPTVRRIRLEPLDTGAMPFSFTAGQYLKVDLPVAVEPIERSYSICSGPGENGFVEIAVKQEPDGLGSTFLHEELAVGQALRVSGPHGEFTCDPAHDLMAGRLLLIGGGVGITPLMSVLVAAADAGHTGRIVLLASFRTEDEVAFRPEIEALRERLPGLEVSIFVTGRNGRIGADMLRAYSEDAGRVHLCGPASMMQDLIGYLTELRVPREAIHTEAFVSGRSKETRQEKAHAIALAAAAAGVTEFTIGVAGGDPAFPCHPGQSVLDAANAADVPLPQSCGEGACGTCRVRVISGAYESDTRGMFSTDELAAGWRLACQTLPTEDLMIAP